MATCDRSRILNFNVGVLGHVDSGKTSLGKDVRLYKTVRNLIMLEVKVTTSTLLAITVYNARTLTCQ